MENNEIKDERIEKLVKEGLVEIFNEKNQKDLAEQKKENQRRKQWKDQELILKSRLPKMLHQYLHIQIPDSRDAYPANSFEFSLQIQVPGLAPIVIVFGDEEIYRYWLPAVETMLDGEVEFVLYGKSIDGKTPIHIVLAHAYELMKEFIAAKEKCEQDSAIQEPSYMPFEGSHSDNCNTIMDELVTLIRDVVREELENHSKWQRIARLDGR